MTGARNLPQEPVERLAPLLPKFAKRAAASNEADSFARKNYAELKAGRLMGIAVPRELGGDGLHLSALSTFLRQMASACPSTALTFSMHLQTIASLSWHWRKHGAPVGSILRRVAREQLAIATTNGSDWLDGSGIAARHKHGYRIDALKRIVSGASGCDLIATNAVYNDPLAGATVLHFLIPAASRGVVVDPTWRASGMRATGSDNVQFRSLWISDRSVIVRRPAGVWHPLYHTAVMLALPLILSVYVGIAETARGTAIESAKKRKPTSILIAKIGQMEEHLHTARIALADMLLECPGEPDIHSTSRILMDRTIAGEACRAAVEMAVQVTGAISYMRGHPLERLFRDVQAVRFHPLDPAIQRDLAGRVALSLDADDTE